MTQRQRSLALLATLVAFAAVVGSYAWFGVYQKGKQEDASKEKTDTLFEFKKEDVRRLSVTARGETTEAERTAPAQVGDGGSAAASEWHLVAPVHALGDAASLDAIADKLAGLKLKREVTAPGNPSTYGLDKPHMKVVATLADGKTAELIFGNDNSYDGTIYAQKGGETRVAILEASVRPPLDKATFDLRDKRLIAFEASELEHLDVATAKSAYALDRSDKGVWQLTAPQKLVADAFKAEQIATALLNLRATRFPTDQASSQDLARYGLAKPSATVALVVGHPAEQITLVFGEVKEGDAQHVYAKRGDQPSIAEVPAEVLKELDQTVTDLRDKTVLSFDASLVTGLTFTSGAETFTATKEDAGDGGAGDSWRLSGSSAGPAKKWRMTSLLTLLRDLKGASIVSEAASDAELEKEGLKPALKTVSILGAGDRVLAQLLVGKEDAGKVFVKAAASPRVLQIDVSRLSQLTPSAQDLAETPPAGDGGAAGRPAATSTPARK